MLVATPEEFPIIVFHIGFILLVGLLFGKLAELVKLPDITGYIVAGLILGPITQFITGEELENLSLISYLALGFIAFQVGNELWLGKLKKAGKKIVTIALIQALITTGIVALLLLFVTDISTALILGAIAATTAPAPIMMLIEKYRAKGKLRDNLVPVVGLDDAIGVIIFGVLLSIGVTCAAQDNSAVNIIEMLLKPLKELSYSLGLGLIFGLFSGLAIRTLTKDEEPKIKTLDCIIITVFITVGVALIFGASPILTPMITGAVVTNMINRDTYVLEEETMRFFIPPIMILFFTISGAELSFSVITSAGLIAIVYIGARFIGKIGGTYVGARIAKSDEAVRKNLGLAMLSQSGVAIGLAIAASTALRTVNPQMGETIHNITMVGVLFFELIGPVMVKKALENSGDINQSKQKTKNA